MANNNSKPVQQVTKTITNQQQQQINNNIIAAQQILAAQAARINTISTRAMATVQDHVEKRTVRNPIRTTISNMVRRRL